MMTSFLKKSEMNIWDEIDDSTFCRDCGSEFGARATKSDKIWGAFSEILETILMEVRT